MAHFICLKKYCDDRGSLAAIQNSDLPFEIKRVYTITNPQGIRGGHRHKKAIQAIVCLSGSCVIYNNNGKKEEEFALDDQAKYLILEPEDWHLMKDFKGNCVLQVLASEEYDINDYIDTPY